MLARRNRGFSPAWLVTWILLSLLWIAEVFAAQSVIRVIRRQAPTYALPQIVELVEKAVMTPLSSGVTCILGTSAALGLTWVTRHKLPASFILAAGITVMLLLALLLTIWISSAFLPIGARLDT